MSTKLAAQTQKAAGIPNGMRTGTVTAVNGQVYTINVGGGLFSSGVGSLSSYIPTVGDVVAVFRQDSSWLILGPTSTAASVAGAWIRFTSLPGGYQNGWTDRGATFPPGQYRRTPTGIQIVGQINNAATQASGAIIVGGLPTPGGEIAGLPAYQGTAPGLNLHVDGAGNLKIYNATTSGLLQFSCTYPIDCIIA